MAQDIQIFTLRGGLDKDSSLNDVNTNDYIEAKDIDFFTQDGNEMNEGKPIQSTSLVYTIPDAVSASKIFEIPYTESQNGYFISLRLGFTNILEGSFVAVNSTDFVNQINNIIGSASTVTSIPVVKPLPSGGFTVVFKARIEMNASLPNATIEFGIYDDTGEISLSPVNMTRDYCEATPFRQVASVQYNNLLFVLSKGIDFPTSELGVVTHLLDGQGGESITYTRLARGLGLNFPTEQFISLRTELFNEDSVAIYYTDYTNTPRVIYCPLNIVQDGILQLNGGRYNLAVIDEQTRLQLINNAMTVSLKNQVNDGGSLKSGGKRYAIRCLVNNSATEWSDLSSLIPVYSASTDGAPFRIKGNKAGEITTKKNVLRLRGINPSVFDFVELAVLEYADDGQASGNLVGRFAVTGDIMDIEHLGSEVGQTLDAITLINNQRPVIEKAKVLEIKDNRMNLANIKTSVSQDLSPIFTNVSQNTFRDVLNWTGKIASSQGTSVLDLEANSFVGSGDLVKNEWSSNIIFSNDDGNIKYDTATGEYIVSNSGFIQIDISLLVNATYRGNPNPFVREGVSPRTREFGTTIYQYRVLRNGNAIALSGDISINIAFEQNGTSTYNGTGVFDWSSPKINVSGGDKITIQLAVYASGSFGRAVSYDVITTSVLNSSNTLLISTSDSNELVITPIEYGEYQDPQNVHDRAGYMLDEVYCFAARVHYKNGYVSKPYPIGSGQYVMGDGSNFSSLTTPVQTFSSGVGAGVYAYGLRLDNIDISSIRNDIVGISICRAEVTTPRVKSAGVFLRAEDVAVVGSGTSFFAGFHASRFDTDPFFNGAPAVTNPDKSYLKRYGAFLSPDTLFNLNDINLGNDELWIYGKNNYKATKPYSFIKDVLGNQYVGYMAEYCVDTSSEESVGADPTTRIDIEDVARCEFNAKSTPLFEKTGIKRNLTLYNESSFTFKTATFRGYGMVLSQNLPDMSQDFGIHYAKIVSKTMPQYNLDDIEYKPIHFIKVDNSTPNIINDIRVWGGDTYNQKTFVKLNYGSANIDGNGYRTGAVSFYSQNRVNTQLRHTDPTVNDYPMFPYNGNLVDWLNNASGREETYVYNYGYITPNRINKERRFNPIFENSGNKTASIYYTEQKPIGAVQDLYREILPVNVKDLDPKDGAIVALYDMKDVIVSIQRDAIMVLPYQSDTLVGTTTGDVVVGSGAVYSRRGNKVSTIGTELTTSVYLAKNASGNPLLYWYSTPYKKFVRYGNDGIKVWSDLAKMRTFFLRETKHIKNEFDIHMGFDSDKSNLYITSKRFGITESPLTWTIVFNESRNRFTHNYSLSPDRWFTYDNRLYIPNTKNQFGKAFLNEGGSDILKFLEDDFGFIQGEMIITPVLNKMPDVDKRILATSITLGGSEYDNNPPFLYTVGENNFESENAPNEWEYTRGCYRTSNNCDYNDDPIMGNAIPIRIKNQLMMRMENIVARFYAKFRTPFK
jgi:hypothetical protein